MTYFYVFQCIQILFLICRSTPGLFHAYRSILRLHPGYRASWRISAYLTLKVLPTRGVQCPSTKRFSIHICNSLHQSPTFIIGDCLASSSSNYLLISRISSRMPTARSLRAFATSIIWTTFRFPTREEELHSRFKWNYCARKLHHNKRSNS